MRQQRSYQSGKSLENTGMFVDGVGDGGVQERWSGGGYGWGGGGEFGKVVGPISRLVGDKLSVILPQ